MGGFAVAGLVACGSASPSAAAPASAPQQGSETVVAIKDFAFKPASLTVAVGGAVTFRNDDSAAHTATADDKSWDSKNLAQGKTFAYTFAKAGTVKYHCDIHQYMTGTIIVR